MRHPLQFFIICLSLSGLIASCSGGIDEPSEQELIARRELLADSIQILDEKMAVLSDQVYRTVHEQPGRRGRYRTRPFEFSDDMMPELKKATRDFQKKIKRLTEQASRIARWDSTTGKTGIGLGTEENNRFFLVEGPERDGGAGYQINGWLNEYHEQLSMLLRTNDENGLRPKRFNRATESDNNWTEATFKDHSLLYSLTKLDEIRLKVAKQGYHFILYYANKFNDLEPPAPKDSLYLVVENENEWVPAGSTFTCIVRVMPDDFIEDISFSAQGKVEALEDGTSAECTFEAQPLPGRRYYGEQPYEVQVRVKLRNGKNILLEHQSEFNVEDFDY